MSAPLLLALAAWRRRGDTTTRDALWRAAGREHEAARILRERPRCLSAVYRGGDAPGIQRPWPLAGAELALDLSARRRVEQLLEDAAAIVEADPEALDLTAIEELAADERVHRAGGDRPSVWPRARRGAWR